MTPVEESTAALAVISGVLLLISLLLFYVVWRVHFEHPGLIAHVIGCTPRAARRVAPELPRKLSAEIALPVGESVAVFPRGGGGGRASRRRSTSKPVLDEQKQYDWEIDPRKLRKRTMIGKGNFGEVWLATWLGSPVAVKLMLPDLQTKERLVKRFTDEILLMSTLHHPNVVLFLGACIRQPNLCLVLEYCVHGSLHHFLKSERTHGVRITMSLLYRFALDIARGVYYLHKRCNVVQRDLKARNILVDESLNAKVADFGLSRILDEDELNKLTACGTPAWTAPEIVKMERYTDKVDVYSFAIIMWELITRQEPYGGQKGVQIAYAAAEQGLRPEIPEYCPEEYAELMRQCWADRPDDRPTFQTILKRLFQLKKAGDIAAAQALGQRAAASPAWSENIHNEIPEDDADTASDARQHDMLAARAAQGAGAGLPAGHHQQPPLRRAHSPAAIAVAPVDEALGPEHGGTTSPDDAVSVSVALGSNTAAPAVPLLERRAGNAPVSPHAQWSATSSPVPDSAQATEHSAGRSDEPVSSHATAADAPDDGSVVDFAQLAAARSSQAPTASQHRACTTHSQCSTNAMAGVVTSRQQVQDEVDLGIVNVRHDTPIWDGDVDSDDDHHDDTRNGRTPLAKARVEA